MIGIPIRDGQAAEHWIRHVHLISPDEPYFCPSPIPRPTIAGVSGDSRIVLSPSPPPGRGTLLARAGHPSIPPVRLDLCRSRAILDDIDGLPLDAMKT
jgi:hypothetical protein